MRLFNLSLESTTMRSMAAELERTRKAEQANETERNLFR